MPFGITDCYIKPYACCRHIQPAVEALFGLLNDENIAPDEIKRVDVETYQHRRRTRPRPAGTISPARN